MHYVYNKICIAIMTSGNFSTWKNKQATIKAFCKREHCSSYNRKCCALISKCNLLHSLRDFVCYLQEEEAVTVVCECDSRVLLRWCKAPDKWWLVRMRLQFRPWSASACKIQLSLGTERTSSISHTRAFYYYYSDAAPTQPPAPPTPRTCSELIF